MLLFEICVVIGIVVVLLNVINAFKNRRRYRMIQEAEAVDAAASALESGEPNRISATLTRHRKHLPQSTIEMMERESLDSFISKHE